MHEATAWTLFLCGLYLFVGVVLATEYFITTENRLSRANVPAAPWLRHKWGQMSVGPPTSPETYRDCVMVNRLSFDWDWDKDGTNHRRPGFKWETLEAWLEKYPDTEVVVLSSGVDRELQIAFDVAEKLHHLKIIVQDTVLAVATYNELLGERRGAHGIMGFFHSTC